MSARLLHRLPLVGIVLVMLVGCEPTGPVTTKGVLTRSPTNPPLPPPPPGAATEARPNANAGQERRDSDGGPRRANPFDRPDAAAAQSPSDPPSSADSQPPPTQPTYAPTSTSKPTLRLSVGLALPQTLPDGTQVGVSVDYKLTSGNLNPSAKYVWVIESRQGQNSKEVQLRPQGGNLADFLPLSIRPEDSPFKAWIEEVSTSGSRVRVSNVESLK